MILTIQQILDSFEKDPRFTGKAPDTFTKTFGSLPPETELIRKELPARLLRFDEDETAAIGVISTLRKDRDDEVLLPEGMDVSNYSGIVLWQHDYWRGEIPHATNMWVNVDPPKGIPYRVVAKTQYLIEMSDLGNDVYRYRLAEHPIGQSVGFRSVASVRKDQTGYDEVYKDWAKRAKDMLRAEGIKATPDEFEKPHRFYTKWELWEYSDVYIGSNPDALQIAVKSGIISSDEAKALVSFKAEGEPQDDDQMVALMKRVSDLEALVDMLKTKELDVTTPLNMEDLWGKSIETEDFKPLSIAEMWDAK